VNKLRFFSRKILNTSVKLCLENKKPYYVMHHTNIECLSYVGVYIFFLVFTYSINLQSNFVNYLYYTFIFCWWALFILNCRPSFLFTSSSVFSDISVAFSAPIFNTLAKYSSSLIRSSILFCIGCT
jgi:hypothetical protein